MTTHGVPPLIPTPRKHQQCVQSPLAIRRNRMDGLTLISFSHPPIHSAPYSKADSCKQATSSNSTPSPKHYSNQIVSTHSLSPTTYTGPIILTSPLISHPHPIPSPTQKTKHMHSPSLSRRNSFLGPSKRDSLLRPRHIILISHLPDAHFHPLAAERHVLLLHLPRRLVGDVRRHRVDGIGE